MTTSYAAQLDLAGRRVLLVGAGDALTPRLAALLRAGAQVTVAVDDLPAAAEDLIDRGRATWAGARWAPADVVAADLVVSVGHDAPLRECCVEHGVLLSVDARDGAERPRPARGRVTLVGGGPGDPGLLTVAGLEALRAADVVVCDRLAPLAALDGLDVEVVDVAKVPRGRSTSQEAINDLLVERAQSGQHVVRLKGGDGYVFGRGGEEAIACAEAGVDVRVIPGLSSAVAGPALAGVPLTHRGVSQGFSVISGHVPPGHSASTVDYAALARSGTTLVLLMAVATLPAILDELEAGGLPAGTPAATIADAGLPSQRIVRSTVRDLARVVAEAGLGAPAITVVGDVVGVDPLRAGAEADEVPWPLVAAELDGVQRTG